MARRSPFFAAALLALAIGTSGIAQAADPIKVAPQGVQQITALKQLSLSRSSVDAKLDSRLYWAVLGAQRDPRMAQFPDLRIVQPETDGRLPVDIVARDAAGVKAIATQVEVLGGVVKAKHYGFRRVSARLPINKLQTLAAMADVTRIRQAIPALTNSMKVSTGDIERGMKVPHGVANFARAFSANSDKSARVVNVSEGDATHGAAQARAFYGATGAGVKICAISDGVDSLAAAIASGDLPPGTAALPGQAGSGDEGTAMLEIIHDLAPAATLGFASALADEATFAQNILDLATSGCNIIVDDIIYLDESPFQDGPVAQSVNTVTAAGVLYFSSAGNEGNANDTTSGTWEGDFLASAAADPAALAGANLHDFGDGGNSILVEVGGGNPPLLIWAEHYDLATGNASTDFDLYDMDGALTTIFDASTDVQDGAGGDDFPIEFIGGGAFAGERLLIDKFAAGTTSSVPAFNLILFRGELANARATSGATRGHSAAAAAFSVAATPAAASFAGPNPGPFPGLFVATNKVETFSSDGPRRLLLTAAGAEITPGNRTFSGGVVRQKPDITAADGVSTSAPGFNPFYGTSAAAPHAAAIAGLLKSAVPGITPAQVRTALIASAIDVEGAGVDRDSGVGIIMAQAALAAAGATPQAFISAGAATATQVAGDSDGAIEPNEDFSLSIPLTNAGGVPATAISATLASSTPGVTVYQATSAYPNLAAAASAPNTTPYLFNVGSAVPCGATINFSLTVSYTGGTSSPQTFNFSLLTGGAGAPVTFSYAGAPVAIPDGADLSGTAPGAPVNATLPVVLAGNVKDVNLSIDGATCSATAGSTTVGIDHSFVNDLEIVLRSPDGTVVNTIDNTDGGGNNLCQTVLDDESVGASIQTVVTANAPFTGSFKPANVLSGFDGLAASGNWQLQAQDFFSQDTGSIRAFSLVITPALCNAAVQPANLTATKTVSAGPYLEGNAVTYTIVITNTGTGIQPDNAGNEFTDTIPAALTVGTPTATSGTVSGGGANPVTWNGVLLPGASVTLTIPATINAGTGGTVVSNQGTLNFDANRDGTNEATALTDDPSVAGAANPTTFTVIANADLVIGLTTSATQAFPNVPVTFTATSLNQGPSTAQDVSITLSLTPDFRFSSLTATGATCTAPQVGTTGNVVCTWAGPTASGVTRTLAVVAYSNVEGLIAVNASTTSATPDPVPNNNAASVSVQVGYLVEEISTLNGVGLMLLGLLLGLGGLVAVRRQV